MAKNISTARKNFYTTPDIKGYYLATSTFSVAINA
jgi:hypothetical protein